MISNATHAYLGITACGCTVAAVVDDPDRYRETARGVYEFMLSGLHIERVRIEEVRLRFGRCPHDKSPRMQGLRLYEVHPLPLFYVLVADEEDIDVTDIMDELSHYERVPVPEAIVLPATSVHPQWREAAPYLAETGGYADVSCETMLAWQQILDDESTQLTLDIETAHRNDN